MTERKLFVTVYRYIFVFTQPPLKAFATQYYSIDNDFIREKNLRMKESEKG